MNHLYVISKHHRYKKTVSGDLVDLQLTNLTKNVVSSHYWDGFLITCIPTHIEDKVISYLNSHERLDFIKSVSSINEYHTFAKEYYKKTDFKKLFPREVW